MYLVVQNFPEERIIFASNSKVEAERYFGLQVKQGKGWFEFREEGRKIPLLAGGEQLYSPYAPSRWDLMQISAEMQNSKAAETEKATFIHPTCTIQSLQSTWE